MNAMNHIAFSEMKFIFYAKIVQISRIIKLPTEKVKL